MVDGKPTSLAELGYNNGGVDDGWQQCDHSGQYWHGAYFHNDTTPNGFPVVNSTLFPDVPGMVKRAHDKGLGINWYMNNCRCNEQNPYPANEANDVAWLIGNGFVSKNDEFCIKNEELFIKNEELCIKNEALCVTKTRNCVLKRMNFAGRCEVGRVWVFDEHLELEPSN